MYPIMFQNRTPFSWPHELIIYTCFEQGIPFWFIHTAVTNLTLEKCILTPKVLDRLNFDSRLRILLETLDVTAFTIVRYCVKSEAMGQFPMQEGILLNTYQLCMYVRIYVYM
jgi:hypothetical protein